MNKFLALALIVCWPPAVFPPLYAGGEQSKPVIHVQISQSIIKEIKASNDKIEIEDAMTKRTDIRKLFSHDEELQTAAFTVIRINGNVAFCTVPGCKNSAVSVSIDDEAGCISMMCEDHRKH